MTEHVSIVGAGVAGLTTATELVARGVSVTIYEKSEIIGAHACSRYAGGMLAPWCERESAEEEVVTLGKGAADWWSEHTDLVVRNGSLVVAQGRDRNELKRFAGRTSNFKDINSEQIAELEPDLAGRFQLGLHFEEEAHLDPRKAIAELTSSLKEKGVTFELGSSVNPKLLSGDVIDTRGFAAQSDLETLRGVKGEMLLLHCPDVVLHRPIRMLHPRIPLYIVPRGDGLFMVGATMIESAERGRITARSMLELLGSAYALHPAFGEAEIIEMGVDVRPAYPDNLPRVTRNGNIISINGLYRHGFLLSPAMAQQAADMIAKTNTYGEVQHAHHA
ncbi:MAG: glycine oxidase ThiO [Rhizobiaceae bacterium]|nr:glycine oxidase ThiO [Rhizobiaceae bacterium]